MLCVWTQEIHTRAPYKHNAYTHVHMSCLIFAFAVQILFTATCFVHIVTLPNSDCNRGDDQVARSIDNGNIYTGCHNPVHIFDRLQ